MLRIVSEFMGITLWKQSVYAMKKKFEFDFLNMWISFSILVIKHITKYFQCNYEIEIMLFFYALGVVQIKLFIYSGQEVLQLGKFYSRWRREMEWERVQRQDGTEYF